MNAAQLWRVLSTTNHSERSRLQFAQRHEAGPRDREHRSVELQPRSVHADALCPSYMPCIRNQLRRREGNHGARSRIDWLGGGAAAEFPPE